MTRKNGSAYKQRGEALILKKRILQWGLVLTLISGFNFGLIAHAKTVEQEDTQMVFTLRRKVVSENGHDGSIPNGTMPTKTKHPQTTNAKSKPSKSAFQQLTSATATGRLPQTNEVRALLLVLVGGLLLIVLILAALIWRQVSMLQDEA